MAKVLGRLFVGGVNLWQKCLADFLSEGKPVAKRPGRLFGWGQINGKMTGIFFEAGRLFWCNLICTVAKMIGRLYFWVKPVAINDIF